MKRKVSLGNGPYYLIRERDGIGDSGGMLTSLDPKTGEPKGKNGEVHLGCCIRCGSVYARSYQHQDFWTCMPILEFLEIKENYVRFKTKNSIYIARGAK